MLRRSFIQLPALLAAQTGLPGFYQNVSSVVWVVDDAAATASKWAKLGIPVEDSAIRMELTNAKLRGEPAPTAMTVLSGNFGSVLVHWVQPAGPSSALSETGRCIFAAAGSDFATMSSTAPSLTIALATSSGSS